MISFSTKYFISYGTPGSEIKRCFLFIHIPGAVPLIVKHGAFGRNKSLVLIIVMGRLETFYNFGEPELSGPQLTRPQNSHRTSFWLHHP
jgi:hypothetical protein